jgi:hypothetical protein
VLDELHEHAAGRIRIDEGDVEAPVALPRVIVDQSDAVVDGVLQARFGVSVSGETWWRPAVWMASERNARLPAPSATPASLKRMRWRSPAERERHGSTGRTGCMTFGWPRFRRGASDRITRRLDGQ